KTTLCKLLNGIIPHHCEGNLSGLVTIDGIYTKDSSVPQLALKTGMVLDDPDAQLFTSTVRREAAFGPENILLGPEEIEERVEFSLNSVGLAGLKNRRPSTLSGGEKQRLVIAAALAMKAKILVLDEPLCRLDPNGAADVMAVLKDIQCKNRITVIMATHDSAKAAEFADMVCVLKNGKIAAYDTAKKIFSNSALLKENGIQPMEENVRGKTRIFTESVEYSISSSASFCVNQEVNLRTLCSVEVPRTIICEISNLSFSYPGGAGIQNINLSVAENEFLAITGDNGCGKTTLLKSITGLLRPAGGDIYIRGKNIKKLKIYEISKDAGFVMQNPDTQLFTSSVYKEVSFALKKMKLSGTEIKQRVQNALETAGLQDTDAFPHALNRADRTKVLIACILAMGCKIIILDEVDVGNDYNGSLKIMNLLRDLHSKGFTIIFVTHNMSLVSEYAHRVIKMDRNGIRNDWRLE
ncbi:MAG: energy-coupling factor ABC transporter ATP-binding protein, partial [Treponema sp.]|nr:energy-coupling factor ABC transporter ATP-binding protein [Treponema sp.]